ncbi:c-type cytochrome [Rheinheimera sp. WS51]|uniref:c-type cytochrome n=1 Tax=Rheinheimera sp. WS51 TaxID=3425886 RepID=UPI003D8C1618
MMLRFCLGVCVFILTSFNVVADDINAGKSKAGLCSACHGNNGISTIAIYPNLAGQKQQYLENAIKAYRNGERKNAIMSPMVMGLSDQDIKNLAAYFASLPANG